MKTAIVYTRVSTTGQADKGTERSQLEGCQQKATELGYEVPSGWVFCETWSGADFERPMLAEARQLIREKRADALIAYSTDRLSRNPLHVGLIAEECEKAGCQLVLVTEPDNNSPEGQLIRYVRGWAGQLERLKISERTLRGKRYLSSQGQIVTGGPPPYGYDSVSTVAEDGRRKKVTWTINPTEANMIKHIFELIANNAYTIYLVSRELNQQQIPAPRSQKWTEETVRQLLLNTAYYGELYVFKYKYVEPIILKPGLRRRKKNRRVLLDKDKWIPIPNGAPPIISKELFDRAHRQLTINRQKSPRNRVHQYLFSGGILRCGICGRAMTSGYRKLPNGHEYRIYRCSSSCHCNIYEPCGMHSIKADDVENAVWEALAESIKKREVIRDGIKSFRETNNLGKLNSEIVLKEKQIGGVKQEKVVYLRQLGKGLIDEATWLKEAHRCDNRIGNLQYDIDDLKHRTEALQQQTMHYDHLENSLDDLANTIEHAEDLEQKRRALAMLNVSATLTAEHIVKINGIVPPNAQQTDTSLRCSLATT
jgi:site-specific DNA recombinase